MDELISGISVPFPVITTAQTTRVQLKGTPFWLNVLAVPVCIITNECMSEITYSMLIFLQI